MWRSLGANINEESAARLANTIEPMELVLDYIDEDCGLSKLKGYRAKGKPEVAVAQIPKDMTSIEAFRHQPGRVGHPSFSDFPSSLFKGLDYRDLHTWMKDLIKPWEALYELTVV